VPEAKEAAEMKHWIKMNKTLNSHWKVKAIAAKCGINEDEVVGKLLRIWSYFDDHGHDGTIEAPYDDLMKLAFEPDLVPICDAMRDVDWLIVTQDVPQDVTQMSRKCHVTVPVLVTFCPA
jgi:hypothetical protein